MTEKDYSLRPIEFDPFAGPEIDKVVPALESQIEIWAACVLGGEDANRSYNESVSLELTGSLKHAALEKALSYIIQRHEALRSGFSANGKQLCIFKEGVLSFTYQDISIRLNDEQAHIITDFLKNDARTAFNLETGPLFRVNLFKQADDRHHLTLSAHHIICDGWSIGVIMQELAKAYSFFIDGHLAALDPAPSFSDYAAEQKIFHDSPEYQRIEGYWLEQFKDDVPVMDIPTDHIRPETRTYISRRDDYKLDKTLINGIREVGSQAGCTFITTMIVAFEVFLHKISGQKDIVLGIPSAGQAADNIYGLVGHCVNMLPVRSKHDQESTFVNFLKLRKSSIFDAYENQQVTFGSLLKKMGAVRDASRIPLIPIVFNIDIGLDDGVKFKDLEHTLVINKREFENFEIFLNASGSNNSLTLEWSYNTYLFEESTIKRMMDDFESLLRAIVENPQIKIGQIRLQPSDTFAKSQRIQNNTDAYYPKEASIHSLIEQTAAEYPHSKAVTFNDTYFTYHQLNARANQLSRHLLTYGIEKDDRVALAVDRSAEMLIALLAILKCGASYVPIDPLYPQKSIEYMLSDSSAKILITQTHYKGRFNSQIPEIILEEIGAKLPTYPDTNPIVPVGGSDLAYIIYTSGSAGKPKGTLLEHHNVVNFLHSMQTSPGITSSDRLLAVTTISFDIAGLELFLPLISGAEVIIADKEAVKDGRILMDMIKSHQISIMQATPSTWKMMIDAGWNTPVEIKALCGGEALSSDLANKLIDLTHEVWNMYGPTETTIWSSIKNISVKGEAITIGRPINNTSIYILDENLHPVMPGLEGQIYIAGEGLARGYLNQPALTAGNFITDVFLDNKHQTIYRTGDLGKFTGSGEIVYLGRIDNQIKIRGHRIELSAIEHFLNQNDEVKEAIVVPKENAAGDMRLVAFIVPEYVATNSHPTWQERWEDLYQRGAVAENLLTVGERQLDIAVAQQISGRQDIKGEVEEWLKQSVDRIKILVTKNTMELGCGAGQLVFEIAPLTEKFVATDYSETAISKLQEKLDAEPEKFRNVTALAAPADDLSIVEPHSLDLIIINGVVQYFPDAEYLLKVLRESSKALKDGGCIFIGDMQGKNTLSMYHALDQLNRSDDQQLTTEFKKIVERRVRVEDELVADPGFFYLLPQVIPAITSVNIQLREGSHLNETTKYHYDIWLFVNGPSMSAAAEVEIPWLPASTIDDISTIIDKNLSKVISITNVFNTRTSVDHRLQEVIQNEVENPTVSKVKAALHQVTNGQDPQSLWNLGKNKGFNTHIRWSSDGADGLFDAIFIPQALGDKIPQPVEFTNLNTDIYEYARNPSGNEGDFSSEQEMEWKQRLKEFLPAYTIPSEFVRVSKMPLLPNGKIDINKLPKPQDKGFSDNTDNLPGTEIEKRVARVWGDVLSLKTLNLNADFFELGGHSLLAVQVMIRMEKETGVRLPLTTLFKYSILEQFAQLYTKH